MPSSEGDSSKTRPSTSLAIGGDSVESSLAAQSAAARWRIAPAWLSPWRSNDRAAQCRRQAYAVIDAASDKLLRERRDLLRRQQSSYPTLEMQAVWDAGHEAINRALWALHSEMSGADAHVRAERDLDPAHAYAVVSDELSRLAAQTGAMIADVRQARLTFVRVQEILAIAEACLEPIARACSPPATATPTTPETTRCRLLIDSTLLYALHANLLPPERMLVAGGVDTSDGIRILGHADVTGVGNPVHCTADPEKFNRAQRGFTMSGSRFVLWVHSHPGMGPQANGPSQIDRDQYAKFSPTYSPWLAAAIFTADGWIRFWGEAIDGQHQEVIVTGRGVDARNTERTLYELVDD